MKALVATEIVNVVQDGDAVRMVCQFCGRMTGRRAEAGLVGLPLGWACAPYPDGYQHADGSTGDLYTCPACDKRTDYPITPREYFHA